MGWHIEALFKTYATDLRNYIYGKVGCPQTAEDLLQETYIKLLRLSADTEIKNIKSYLFRIAGNVIIDHHRAMAHRLCGNNTEEISRCYDIVDERPSTEDIVINQDRMHKAIAAVVELSTLCQQIFELSNLAGLKNREIADQLGICQSTVEKNLARVRKHCCSRVDTTYPARAQAPGIA